MSPGAILGVLIAVGSVIKDAIENDCDCSNK